LGVDRGHWSDASPVRGIFRKPFQGAGLPYFAPHSFRHTLGHLGKPSAGRNLKAWSQNLGHENIATTLTSYGRIDPHRQGDVIARIRGGALGCEMDGAVGEITAILERERLIAAR
jgi:integrase